MSKMGYVANEKPVSGLAEIKVSETGQKVKVIFKNHEEGKQGFEKVFSTGFLPDVPKHIKTGTYWVKLSSDKTEVDVIRPSKGIFDAVVKDFNRNDAGEPVYFEKPSTYNPNDTVKQFTPLMEVTKGEYKGVVIPLYLKYAFTDNGQGYAAFSGNPDEPKATRIRQLYQFCDMLGLIDDEIVWPEDGNILPELLRRCLANKRKLTIVVKDGYISEFLLADTESDESVPSDEDFKDDESKQDNESEPVEDDEF